MRKYKRIHQLYWSAVFILALASLGFCEKQNELRLAGVLSNNAVLQRNQPLPIWGTAQPNSTVTVKFSGQVKQGKVGPLGKWKIILDPLKANSTPQSLLVQSSESNKLSIENILIGDVWLCSGQSNMAFTLAISARKVPAIQQRLSEANNSLLRLATKSKANYNTNPSNDECQWKVTTPESSREFSAVGYFFGEQLQSKLNIPIGIINSSVGGSMIEQWMPRDQINNLKACKRFVDRHQKALEDYPKILSEFKHSYPTDQALKAENKARKQRGEKSIKAPRDPSTWYVPSQLFDGMITPLIAYPLTGVLWYQGEGNVWQFSSYDQMMVGLIQSWRKLWGQPNLPFIMTELAPYNEHKSKPHDSARSRFGVTLAKAAHQAGHAWTITIPDGGEQKDIHPARKDIPGERFAAMALSKVYGQGGIAHGPMLESWIAKDSVAILTFTSTGGGLIAKNLNLDGHDLSANELKGFQLADEHKNFYRAKAIIKDANTVIVSHPKVTKPSAVRYAWDNFPLCNLYNQEDFAAYPFRTDDWPWQTPK